MPHASPRRNVRPCVLDNVLRTTSTLLHHHHAFFNTVFSLLLFHDVHDIYFSGPRQRSKGDTTRSDIDLTNKRQPCSGCRFTIIHGTLRRRAISFLRVPIGRLANWSE